MARKTPTDLREPETEAEAPPAEQVAKTSKAEPTTVNIATQRLAEALAGYAFALAAFGADGLSPEGRAVFRNIIADLDNTKGSPPARCEVPADGAFWISTDLLNSRHQRPALTGGEVVLGQAVSRQTPELARRLSAVAARRPRRQGIFPTRAAAMESPVLVTDPASAKYPNGAHFDGLGRPMGPKLATPTRW